MRRVFPCFVWTFCLGITIFAQATTQDVKTLTDAAKGGSNLTVSGSVNAQAVLIPQRAARRIFGKEIAENYAVVEVNVGNKSNESILIVHGIFIDYTRWALSGTMRNAIASTTDAKARADQYQTSTDPGHVASEEYRVVRGELLDAQTWTARNWTVRLLTLFGSVAGGYSYMFKERGVLKGIAAFNGIFVPGVDQAWPDATIAQLNRVSDFGYRSNMVVPKQSSEIIVCFFPIDRFLSPGFRKLFLKSPALFFAPLQMLLDQKIAGDVEAILGKDFEGVKLKDLRNALPCYLRINQLMERNNDRNVHDPMDDAVGKTCLPKFGLEANDKGLIDFKKTNNTKFMNFLILDYISQISLNNVKVVVDGIMTVDTTSIAAKIDDIKFQSASDGCGDGTPCFWLDTKLNGGVRTGIIKGAYLTGGKLEIEEAKDKGIEEVKIITEDSNDQELRFSFKLTKEVLTSFNLTFKITKALAGASNPKGQIKEYIQRINFSLPAPTITKVDVDASNKLTVTGTGFFDNLKGKDLKVLFYEDTKPVKIVEVPATDSSIKISDSTKLLIDLGKVTGITKQNQWFVTVKVGDSESSKDEKNKVGLK